MFCKNKTSVQDDRILTLYIELHLGMWPALPILKIMAPHHKLQCIFRYLTQDFAGHIELSELNCGASLFKN